MHKSFLYRIAFFCSLCIICPMDFSMAQVDPNAFGYYEDVARFSAIQQGGNARHQGIGGANTAIGGDISSAYTNPAGLGFMRRGEITFSPGLSFNNTTSSTEIGEETRDGKLNLNFAHLGASFYLPSKGDGGYKGGTIAITMARVNHMHNRFTYSEVSDASLIDYFLEGADGIIPWGNLDAQIDNPVDVFGLAYSTFLINPDFDADAQTGTQNNYYSFVPVSPNRKEETVHTRGAQSTWNISYGGNWNDKFFFGAGLGIQSLRFEQTKTYTEEVLDSGPDFPLSSLVLEEDLRIRGTGFNFTAGFIYRPIFPIRIGASFTTPTYYLLNEEYEASLAANYNNFNFDDGVDQFTLNNEFARTNILTSSYHMITPMRINGGAAVFLGRLGFITADVEFLDYSQGRLLNPEPQFSLDADNRTIGNLYGQALNFRLGGEVRADVFRFRAGVAYYGDPLQSELKDQLELPDRSQLVITGGIGLHLPKMYLGLTIGHRSWDTSYTPFQLQENTNPVVSTKNSLVNAIVSVGFHF
ncbi:MAG: hypothetical protein JJT94_12935 [Bernardetiaceae bacterium]|nr:hypothetical protein [Bernardetiaceae bacterium]